ncbi:3-ketoacyl-ACP reductase [Mesobacillus campisalis]|uniref:3-ketoacyl-ACP reductase n=1 Tax=Mesobacillus campisalis TaxID=1408103 RepID=A0A0M2SXQ3_9BACI|nr:glucose 1-dehydrogenase [Mesobacillus campisalis]KKK37767.1 3-ketoacyl-ACP reductase [Mesobacillus campisalis]
MNFEKQVVIVTGAANGIGQGIAAMYAEKGAIVVVADYDKENGTQVTELIKDNGGEAMFVPTDVRREEDIKNLMKTAYDTYGRIDILINNAGKGLFKSPYDVTIDEWDDVIFTNLRSVFLGSREAAKYMRKNENGGAIVNIASTRAIMSEPNSEAYAASKGGITGITHALAASFAQDGIAVNCISPGWIETGDYASLRDVDHRQHFSNRVGRPDDIARACLYLTARENNFVNGINLVVDGGMTRKMIYEE